MADLQGLHVALTVSNLSVSGPWYRDLFGGQVVFEGNDGVSDVTIFALPGNQLVGLRQHAGTRSGDVFVYDRIGLDHLAFHVTTREELEDWQRKLDDKGVAHSGIQESSFGHHLNFKDPDGIALEFMAPVQS
jgi:catechol-2,3-dioxygenase